MPHYPDSQAKGRDDLLADLTEAQREAVLHTEGPLLILAAAGSGKTRVITRRIAYLVSLGVPPWQILALTFTNKAAAEMRQRVLSLLGADEDSAETNRRTRGLTLSTFHALCARLLRRYAPLMAGAPGWGIRDDYTIYDADDQNALMKKVLADLELSSTNWPARMVLARISAAKNELMDAETFGRAAVSFDDRTIAKAYRHYEAALRTANAVDFDDLLMLSVRVLRESEEARREVQERWKYLMIDEYQDTNHAQFVLASLICTGENGHDAGDRARGPNICVVGDPDQSIYGWRGADISNILEFEERYPGARVIALGENFRSTAPILAAADALIRNNKQRKHKPLFTRAQGGDRIEVARCADEHHEAQHVVNWLKHLAESGSLAWKDMAVFYRNNALSRVAEDALRRAGIPYIVARGTAFYQREEVKDLLSYLRLIANEADDVSLRRIANKPARKISRSTMDVVETWAERWGVPLLEAMRRADKISDLGEQATGALRKFVQLIDSWTSGGTFMGARMEQEAAGEGGLRALVSRVLGESGLERHYKELAAKTDKDSDEDRVRNLGEIVSAAAEFEAAYDPGADPALSPRRAREDEPPIPPLLAMLRAYLESVSLVADADKVDPASGAVMLMTLHAAKGLEFPAVAMIGLEEGLLPGVRAMEASEGIEEERRLCFVGMTRAKRKLLMTHAKVRSQRGVPQRAIASRFLLELPREQIIDKDLCDEWLEDVESGFGYGPARARESAERREAGSRPSGHAGTRGRGTAAFAENPGGASESHAADGIASGVTVRHPQFGVGCVEVVQGAGINRRAKIRFRDVGTKTLVLAYARLEMVPNSRT